MIKLSSLEDSQFLFMPDNPISEYLKELTKPAGELANPTVRILGLALGALTEAGLHRIGISKVLMYNAQQNRILNDNIKKLEEDLQSHHPDNIIEVNSEIVHPIVERLSYISEEHLSDLFIKLLAKAALKDQVYLVHPAYISIVDQLSPDEAILLKEIGVSSIATIKFGIRDKRPEKSGLASFSAKGFSRLSEIQELAYPDNMELYNENLISLGLIQIKEKWFLPEENANGKNIPSPEYNRLSEIAKSKISVPDEHWEFFHHTGILELTEKGRNFVKAVTRVLPNEESKLVE